MDPVLGLDVHVVNVPPSIPTPIPMPFVGMVFDPMGMLVGSAISLALGGGMPPVVRVNGLPVTNCGTEVTNKLTLPHLPVPGVAFIPPPMPGNDAELFFGSNNVSLEGSYGVRLGDTALSCSDPVRLPTSIVMALPKGCPVLNCPAMVPDLAGIAMAFLMRLGIRGLGALASRGAALFRRFREGSRFFQGLSRRLGGCTPPANAGRFRQMWARTVRFVTGHPVDVVTGNLFTEAVEFELPGPLPLKFERVYESAGSSRGGALGYGWSHTLDESLWIERMAVVVRLGDGREVEFPTWNLPERRVRAGDVVERAIHKLKLRCIDGARFELEQPDGRVHVFAPVEGGDPRVARLRQIRSGDGHHGIELGYDLHGRLDWARDSGGRLLRFEHDDEGRLTGLLLPKPKGEGHFRCRSYRYDEYGDLVEVRDVLGGTYRYVYQGHLLVQETNRVGLSFYFQYDDTGSGARCVRTWGDGGIYDHVIHYDLANRKTIVENSLGHVTLYEYDHRNQVVAVTGARGGVTRYAYDLATAQTTEESAPDGATTRSTFDGHGNLLEQVGPDGARIAMVYDAAGLPVAATDAIGGLWQWKRDERGRVRERLDPLGQSTGYEYAEGLLVGIRDAAGGETRLAYDGSGNLSCVTYPDGTRSRYQCDQLGRRTHAMDPKGNVTHRVHDALGCVTRVDEPDGNVRALTYDAEGSVVRARDKHYDVMFGYQGVGRLSVRSQAGTEVRFEYDTEERLTAIINEHGHVYRFKLDATGEVEEEHGFDGLLRQYQRDAAGRVAAVLRPGERLTRYAYDPAGRVIEVKHWDGTGERYAYRADGALMEAVNDTIPVRFERDALGRVTREWQGDHWVASTYGALGLRTGMSSSFGVRQTITRNVMGDVMGVREEGSGFEVQFKRDELGLELERVLPGGVRSHWERDAVGRPTQHVVTAGSKTLRAVGYQWDVNDRLRRVIDGMRGPTEYTHDAVGNLAGARYPDGTVELRNPDAVGNLFRTEDRSDRGYGPAGQLLWQDTDGGRVTYDYDEEGRLIHWSASSGETCTLRWSATGLLKSVTRSDVEEVVFGYDALGRRVSKTLVALTTRWMWDGNLLLHERLDEPPLARPEAIGRVERESACSDVRRSGKAAHWCGPRDRLGAMQKEALVTWLFSPDTFAPSARLSNHEGVATICDHLGAPVLMVDGEGAPVWGAAVGLCGALRNSFGDRSICPLRWAGQYEDEETGLRYNRFRYYDPVADRYCSPDPIGLAGGTRPYAYVRDPLVLVDPFGLAATYCDASRRWRDTDTGRYISRPDDPARLVNGGAIDMDDLQHWLRTSAGGMPTNVWTPSPDFPTGGFRYDVSEGARRIRTWGHGANPSAIANHPGSNAALGPTVRVHVTAPGGGVPPTQLGHLSTSGAYVPATPANMNDIHIPLGNSPF